MCVCVCVCVCVCDKYNVLRTLNNFITNTSISKVASIYNYV